MLMEECQRQFLKGGGTIRASVKKARSSGFYLKKPLTA
jgi:hypothetical protein